MTAGDFLNALLALTALVAFGTLFGAAMIWCALKIAGGKKLPPLSIYGDWPNVPGELRAGAGTNQAGERTVGHRLSGTQTKQTQRTNPFRTGDEGASR